MYTQQGRYNMLVISKGTYISRLDQEVKRRKINEQEAFNKLKLNIKLPKFKGYKSCIDIYTFQSDESCIRRAHREIYFQICSKIIILKILLYF